MYNIWNADLYMINNCFWDTRAQKIERLIEDMCYKLPPLCKTREEYKKDCLCKIARIFFDVVSSVTPKMLATYTPRMWSELHYSADCLNMECKKKHWMLLIKSNGVFSMVKTAIEYEKGAGAGAGGALSDEFWDFVTVLSRYVEFCDEYIESSFRLSFIKILHENVVAALDPGAAGAGAEKKSIAKFVALITVLYYAYNNWVEQKMVPKITLDEFPKHVLDAIEEHAKTIHDTIFEGARLVTLMRSCAGPSGP